MADYAISNVPRRVVYAASGTGPYAFTFEILSQTDIAVYKASTLLTLTTDYTVTINANGTGSVTLVVTAGTSNITIVGAKNIQRTTDFTTGGDLFANTLNDELDNQTIFIQQVAETAERGLKAPVTDPTDIAMTLPAKADRASKYLGFDSNGNPVASSGTGADVVSTAMEPVVSAATLAAGRTNFGLGSIATQAASAVAVTGGTITGITDLAIADGGTGASTAENARINLGVDNFGSMKSRIINGAMVIDQRNAGATQAITSAGTPTYCLDRWAVSLGNTASGTLTTQRVSGDAINQYAVRIARTAGTYADNIRFHQVIETSNCYDLQGNNITISWRARQGSSYAGGAQVLTIITGSGTDQGIASMVSGTWTSSAFNFPTVTGTLSTSFSTFTATFAVPAGTTEIGLRISTGNFSGTGSANDYLDITGVQLEKGTQATSFEYRQYGTELALCQRYYEKSYSTTVVPATATAFGAVILTVNSQPSGYLVGSRPFIVQKRITPSVTIYSVNGTAGTVSNGDTNDYAAGASNQIGTNSFGIQNISGSTYSPSANIIYFHFIASAEL